MSSGISKELNVQNVSYFIEFLSCLEKRDSLIRLDFSNKKESNKENKQIK